MVIKINQSLGMHFGREFGKQPLYKTRNTKVKVLLNGELKECALVFINNGFDFHLEVL